MSASIHVRSGETLQFPVAPNHPLARIQSVRAATEKDLVNHAFYSKVIKHRMEISRAQQVAENRISAELSKEAHQHILQSVIWKIGPIQTYQLDEITVDNGGKLIYFGNYHAVSARNVTIQNGGIVRCYCSDPTISATLLIVCELFGHGRGFTTKVNNVREQL
jgi:hypothetical protein